MPAKRRSNAIDDAGELLAHRRQRGKIDTEDVNVPDVPYDGDTEPPPTNTSSDPADARGSTEALDAQGLSSELLRRVSSIRSYTDPKRGLFYINLFPTTLQFGRESLFDMSNYVVYNDNKAALTWILGRLYSFAFLTGDGQVRDSAYVVVKPLSTKEVKSASILMNEYSRPPMETESNLFGTILANRMQSRFGSDRPAELFNAVYDATNGMKPKGDLAKLDARRLKRSDLVLLEARLRKRFPAGALSDVPKSELDYTLSFQLQAIFLVKVGDEDDNMDDDAGIQYDF